MQILINTDNNITQTEALATYATEVITETLSRYSKQITRVEVHLGDENSNQKNGSNDKRCLIEVRLEKRPPASVVHHADSIELAIDGSADKLKTLLNRTLERLRDSRSKNPTSMP